MPPSLIFAAVQGELAQLARALAWHARGRRFDSDILHLRPPKHLCRRVFLLGASADTVHLTGSVFFDREII